MFETTFRHPKFGKQYTSRKTKKEIIDWLSYMVKFHEISDIKLFENSIEIKEFKIPTW